MDLNNRAENRKKQIFNDWELVEHQSNEDAA